MAVWLQGKTIYNAYDIARTIGYQTHSADRRRRLEHHEGELILHGGISSDEYRMLFCAHTDSLLTQVASLSPLVVQQLPPYQAIIPRYSVKLPVGALDKSTDAVTALLLEYLSLNGILHPLKFCILVLAMAGQHWRISRTGRRTTVDTGEVTFYFNDN